MPITLHEASLDAAPPEVQALFFTYSGSSTERAMGQLFYHLQACKDLDLASPVALKMLIASFNDLASELAIRPDKISEAFNLFHIAAQLMNDRRVGGSA